MNLTRDQLDDIMKKKFKDFDKVLKSESLSYQDGITFFIEGFQEGRKAEREKILKIILKHKKNHRGIMKLQLIRNIEKELQAETKT